MLNLAIALQQKLGAHTNVNPRSSLSKLQATVILHTVIFMKNKPHHDGQSEKLNNICKKSVRFANPVYTDFGPYWHSLLNRFCCKKVDNG